MTRRAEDCRSRELCRARIRRRRLHTAVAALTSLVVVTGLPVAAHGDVAHRRAGSPVSPSGPATFTPVALSARRADPSSRRQPIDRDAALPIPVDLAWGSGEQLDYTLMKRDSSSRAELRAAAQDPHGCLIIGDSLAQRGHLHLAAALHDSVGARCVHESWAGRRTEGTANALFDIWAHEGLPRSIIVLAGANDVFRPPAFEEQARRLLLASASAERVLWVTPYVARRNPETSLRWWADESNSRYLASVLRRLTTEYPRLTLVPWAEFFDGHPERQAAYMVDAAHTNDQGKQLMALMIQRAWR